MGFISSLGLGKLFGFISLTDVSQAFILGLFGAMGGWIGNKIIVFLIKKVKILIINNQINKSKK